MKKKFFGKFAAMLLTFVMVITLMPAGTLGVFAEDTASVELTDGVYVIDSVADWVAVSEDESYADKTVKLGADIDFGATAAPVLFGTFTGTFYGNGRTVSGASLAGINLIATVVNGGTVDGGDGVENSGKVMTISGFDVTTSTQKTAFVAGQVKGRATIENVTVSGCKITSTTSVCSFVVGDIANDTADSAPIDNFDSICATISNCTVENCIGSFKHQSGMILGTVSDKGYASVVGCKVTGSSSLTTTNGAAAGMIIGKMNAGSYAVITGCETGSEVVLEAKGTQTGYALGAGMIVGNLKETAASNGMLTVSDCVAKGTIISKASNTGGIVGSVASHETCTISNCTVDVQISSTAGNGFIGGIIGAWYPSSNSSLNISKCDVRGTITDTKSTGEASPRFGGIIGASPSGHTSEQTSVIEDCYVDMDISTAMPYGRVGGIFGDWGVASATLNIEDCYYEGTLSATNVGGVGARLSNSAANINNVIVVSDTKKVCFKEDKTTTTIISDCYATNETTQAGFAVISDTLVEGLVKYDGNGDIAKIRDHFNCNLVQVSEKGSDGTYSIRFIGTSVYDTVSSASMTVSADVGSEKVEFSADCEAYDTLDAYTGVDAMTAIDANAFGAEKFFAVIINGIPAEGANDIVFTITLKVTVDDAEYNATFSGKIPPAATAE